MDVPKLITKAFLSDNLSVTNRNQQEVFDFIKFVNKQKKTLYQIPIQKERIFFFVMLDPLKSLFFKEQLFRERK